MLVGFGRARRRAAGLLMAGLMFGACGIGTSSQPTAAPSGAALAPTAVVSTSTTGSGPGAAPPSTTGSVTATGSGPAANAPAGNGTATGTIPSPAAARPAPEPVTVSWVNSLTIAPFFVAVDRGYFQEQGVE